MREADITAFGTAFLARQNINSVIEVALSVALLLYFIYAFLVSKQVKILNEAITTDGAWFLNLLALLHLSASALLFIMVVARLL